MSAGEHKQSQRRGHSRSHNKKSQSQRIKAKQEPPAPIPSIPSTAVSIAGNQSFPLPVPPAQDTRGRPPTCSGMKAATALTARRAPQQPVYTASSLPPPQHPGRGSFTYSVFYGNKSQNHRVSEAGRNSGFIWPNPCSRGATLSRVPSKKSRWILKMSKEERLHSLSVPLLHQSQAPSEQEEQLLHCPWENYSQAGGKSTVAQPLHWHQSTTWHT